MTTLFSDLISPDTKVCNRCKEVKPATTTYFQTQYGKKNALRAMCIACVSPISKERDFIRRNTPPAPLDHCCPICDKTQEELNKPWELDHIHGTTYFRDWICQQCNQALGKFNDDPLTVVRAADYLVKHEELSKKTKQLNTEHFI